MNVAKRLTTNRFAVVPLLALLAIGCRSQFEPRPPESPPTPTQIAVLLAADDYDSGPERPAIDTIDRGFTGPTVPDNLAPNMTIATMTLRPGRPEGRRRLLARITSDGDYPPMGIRRGMNFVWRDTWANSLAAAQTWTNWVTPSRAGEPSHRLVRDPRLDRFANVAGHHTPNLLKLRVNSTGFLVCLGDPACPSGHCGNF